MLSCGLPSLTHNIVRNKGKPHVTSAKAAKAAGIDSRHDDNRWTMYEMVSVGPSHAPASHQPPRPAPSADVPLSANVDKTEHIERKDSVTEKSGFTSSKTKQLCPSHEKTKKGYVLVSYIHTSIRVQTILGIIVGEEGTTTTTTATNNVNDDDTLHHR